MNGRSLDECLFGLVYGEIYIMNTYMYIHTHTIILNYEQLFGELITLTLGKNVNHTMYLCYVIYDN